MSAVFNSTGTEIASAAEVDKFVADEKYIAENGTLPGSYGDQAGTAVPTDGSSVQDASQGATAENGDTAAQGNRSGGNSVNPAIFDAALLSGHPGYQPVGLNKTAGVGYSKDVFCNGSAALRVGNKFELHDIPPNPKDPPHADEIATGCANVFCNGGGMARPGDKMRGKGAIFGRLTKSCYNVYIPNKGLL